MTKWYYKVRQLFYYQVRLALLQSATGITKCDECYYKVRQVLQNATSVITKCDRYYKVRRYYNKVWRAGGPNLREVLQHVWRLGFPALVSHGIQTSVILYRLLVSAQDFAFMLNRGVLQHTIYYIRLVNHGTSEINLWWLQWKHMYVCLLFSHSAFHFFLFFVISRVVLINNVRNPGTRLVLSEWYDATIFIPVWSLSKEWARKRPLIKGDLFTPYSLA